MRRRKTACHSGGSNPTPLGTSGRGAGSTPSARPSRWRWDRKSTIRCNSRCRPCNRRRRPRTRRRRRRSCRCSSSHFDGRWPPRRCRRRRFRRRRPRCSSRSLAGNCPQRSYKRTCRRRKRRCSMEGWRSSARRRRTRRSRPSRRHPRPIRCSIRCSIRTTLPSSILTSRPNRGASRCFPSTPPPEEGRPAACTPRSRRGSSCGNVVALRVPP